jgi:hypothetical protein
MERDHIVDAIYATRTALKTIQALPDKEFWSENHLEIFKLTTHYLADTLDILEDWLPEE